VSPVLPGITDFKKILTACKSFVDTFCFENLNLRGSYRLEVLKYIRAYHPHLTQLYDDMYIAGGGADFWSIMEKDIADFCTENNISFISYFYHDKIKKKH
jgi:hypothetical protein